MKKLMLSLFLVASIIAPSSIAVAAPVPSNMADIGIVTPDDAYREWTEYIVTEVGETASRVWLGSTYYIASIAKGMTYTESQEVSSTVTAVMQTTVSSGAMSKIRLLYGLSSTNTKTVRTTVELTGPESWSPYNTRVYYYRPIRNRRKVKIVTNYRSNWDGIISTTISYAYIDVPAIETWSVGRILN